MTSALVAWIVTPGALPGASTRPDANSTVAAAIGARPASHLAMVLVGDDIDHPAQSAAEGEVGLARRDFCAEREPPERTLELIDDGEAARGACSWRAARLPMSTVVNEHVNADALGRDRPE